MGQGATGRTFYRGEAGYEAARSAAVKNARLPQRFPDVIVQAASDADVIAAVRLAKRNGLKIGVRSGGHSWAGAFLRDGGMLIDLSQMNALVIDREARTAEIQPGLIGTELNRALAKYDLCFPTGHCMSVGLGGFLLQGGFGWNSRVWGPACVSVRAIDVVTADGEMWHADAKRSADLLWAARGAGPGFFGVVTRFYLTVYPRPRAFLKSDYVYPIEVYDEVLRFVHAVQPKLSRAMECLVFTRRDILGHPGPGALLTAPVIADTEEEAREALAILDQCPVRAKAVMADVNASGSLDQWLQGAEDLLYPPDARYAADNMWTHAPVEALLPGMRDIARTLPEPPSHMMWMLWGPTEPRPDMAFSMEDDLYIALYSVWRNERDDARHQAWVTDHMKALEPLASGIQLADENLAARPFKFIAAANLARLEKLRAKYDPGGLFHTYMGKNMGTPRGA
jgi:FAD/FMN-containing dehydrogenase